MREGGTIIVERRLVSILSCGGVGAREMMVLVIDAQGKSRLIEL
jgi:hypothetical protein